MQQPPDFVPSNQPSPTSTLGINLRYYHLTSETGQTVYWDLGVVGENLLENGFDPTGVLSLKDFERMTREGMEQTLLHGVQFTPTVFFSIFATGSTTIYDATIASHEQIMRKMTAMVGGLAPTLKPKEPPAFQFKTASW